MNTGSLWRVSQLDTVWSYTGMFVEGLPVADEEMITGHFYIFLTPLVYKGTTIDNRGLFLSPRGTVICSAYHFLEPIECTL